MSVVGWGSVGTVLGWVLWDHWVGQEEAAAAAKEKVGEGVPGNANEEERRISEGSTTDSGQSTGPKNAERELHGLGLVIPSVSSASRQGHSHSTSATSFQSATSSLVSPSAPTGHPTGAGSFASYSYYPPYDSPDSILSPRNQQRLATAKSAILIYCALLGLSPILKSLTMSTTEDSIWAMSSWLMCINVVFFDYGGEVGAKYVPCHLP